MKTDYLRHDRIYQKLKEDKGAIGWDRTPAAYEEIERRLRSILALCKLPPCGRLLELGCGAGNISLWLEQQGYEATGVDISPTAIAWATSKCLDVSGAAKFFVGNVLNLHFLEDGCFDIVLDGHCLHCIIENDRDAFLSESLRLLKPRGWLLIDTMCGPVAGDTLRRYDPETQCTIQDGIATRYFGLPEEIEREVRDAGFEVQLVIREHEDINQTITIVARKPAG